MSVSYSRTQHENEISFHFWIIRRSNLTYCQRITFRVHFKQIIKAVALVVRLLLQCTRKVIVIAVVFVFRQDGQRS